MRCRREQLEEQKLKEETSFAEELPRAKYELSLYAHLTKARRHAQFLRCEHLMRNESLR